MLGGGSIGKLAAKNSRVNMREKIYNQPMRRLYLQRHENKARDKEVSVKINKGILAQS